MGTGKCACLSPGFEIFMDMNGKILLTGPAACGKTHAMLEDFERTLREADDPLRDDFFYILPSAEHSSRIISLLLRRGLPGFFHRRVTTLTRLVSTLFETGDEHVASNTTRYLILKKIIAEREWPCFAEVQKTSGFHNLMLSFLGELKESLLPVEAFREKMNAMKKLEPELAAKYEALAGIYEAYQEALTASGFRDRADDLFLYRAQKMKSPEKRFKKLWLDGFFDFSDLQKAYLEELSAITDGMIVSLTMDPSSREELFAVPRETEASLLSLGFERHELRRPENIRPLPPALSTVEKNIFRERTAYKPAEAGTEIAIFEAVGMEGEIEMIVRTIQHMQRRFGYRFSDFAILLRQIGDYESIIRSIFRRYDIPVEIHERERVSFSPMIVAVTRLLRIFRDGWKLSDLMEFLKSSYVRSLGGEEKDYEWVSALEQTALIRRIFSGREKWSELTVSDDRFRRLQVLFDMEDRLRSCSDFAGVQKTLITAVEKIFELVSAADVYQESVRRDAASYKRFLSILEEIEFSFRAPAKAAEGETVDFERFADRFFRLVDLDLYSLHESDRNRVQVYNISLARQKEYHVVFLAGLLEKKFPVQMREDPVLSDWERALFNGAGPEGRLKEHLPRQSLERYLFYVAVTRARRKLILSYPRLDLEGKEYLPSYYVDEVRALFKDRLIPNERKQRLGQPYPDLREAVTERELEMSVMGGLWHARGLEANQQMLLLYLTNEFLARPASRERFARAFYTPSESLSDPGIRALDPFRSKVTSSSRLEEYAKCSFRYYVHQVLKLYDPEEDTNITARGTILHDVLENCFRNWQKTPGVMLDKKKAKEQAFALLDDAVRKKPLILDRSYRYDLEYDLLREMIGRFLDVELDRLRSSLLQPRYFEYDFGGEAGDAEAFEIEDGERRIRIRGKIDRIDLDPAGKTGLVLDYKRTASFDRGALDLGISLQLPIYTMVLEHFLKARPAGAELYSLKDLEKKGFYHAEHTGLFPDLSSRRLILEESRFRELLERTRAYIRKFSRDMENLKIEVRPRECVSFCAYSAICRVEKWRIPMMLEEIREEDRKAGLAPAGSGQGDGGKEE